MPYKKLLTEGGYMLAKKAAKAVKPLIKKAVRKITESRAVKMHDTELTKRFGSHRADAANFGWASGDDFISSKVYRGKGGKPTEVLTTRWNEKTGRIEHQQEPY